MSIFKMQDTIGEVVSRHPALSRVFEQMGIDYCCGGKKTLDEVCRKKGIEPKTLILKLEEAVSSRDTSIIDAAAMSLTELVDHIEQTHHAYLYAEFPRLEDLACKVISAHGEKNPRLYQIKEIFRELSRELARHMDKEEKILFPMVRQLDSSVTVPVFHCGSVSNPIHQMEIEHYQAGSELEKLRELTENYTLPDWACNTYRALMDALAHLEYDLHQHIHKENNVLFPRTIEMEIKKRA